MFFKVDATNKIQIYEKFLRINNPVSSVNKLRARHIKRHEPNALHGHCLDCDSN